jgi:oligopeptide/dipeptide ABC transporter ATP-binding protein
MPSIELRLENLVAIEGSPPSLVDLPSGCPFTPRCPFAFSPCVVELPELTMLPGGHLDRCHLSAEQKRATWAAQTAERLGVAR